MSKKTDSKREKIIQSAKELFANNGYYFTNINEITRNSGIATGTFYLYFKTKEDLMVQMFESLFEDIPESVSRILGKDLSPLDKFREIIKQFIFRISDDFDWARLVLIEMRQSNKALRNIFPKLRQTYLEIIIKLLKEAQEKDLVKNDLDSNIIGVASFGIIDSLLFDWIINNYSKEQLFENIEKSIDYFVNGIK